MALIDYSRVGLGVSNAVFNLADSLADLGVNVYLFSPHTIKSKLRQEIKVCQVPTSSLKLPIFEIMDFSNNVGTLLQKNYKNTIDIIHANGPLSAVRLFGSRLPVITTAHGTLYSERKLSWLYPIGLYGKITHGSFTSLTYFFEKTMFRFADRVIAVSSKTKVELESIGVKPNKIIVIPNGVATNFFKPLDSSQKQMIRKKMGLNNSNIVLFVGNFAPLKGLHILIQCIPEVLRHHPNTVFLFSGAHSHTGNYDRLIEQQIETLKIKKNVIFTGFSSHEALLLLYNVANVFVSASFTEGCALNILEAASCGTPVIASNVGGASDVLGDYGMLFQPGHYLDLANHIVEILNDRSKQEKMGLCLRARINTNFQWTQIAQRTICEYERMTLA